MGCETGWFNKTSTPSGNFILTLSLKDGQPSEIIFFSQCITILKLPAFFQNFWQGVWVLRVNEIKKYYWKCFDQDNFEIEGNHIFYKDEVTPF